MRRRLPLLIDASSLHIADLANQSLILPGQRSCIRRRFEKLCLQHNLQITPVFEVDSLSLRVELVRRWNAATILPYAAAHGELARGDLIYRPIAMSQPLSSATASIRSACSAVIAEAASILGQSMADLVNGGAWPKATLVT